MEDIDFKLSENEKLNLQFKHKPQNKNFEGKPYERSIDFTRQRTRPWDNVWFSRKPHITILTIEQAIEQYPKDMIWYFSNLKNINWSVYTIRLVKEKLNLDI